MKGFKFLQWSLLILGAMSIVARCAKTKVQEENGILLLNDKTFHITKDYENVLIHFHKSGSKKSQDVIPALEEVASILKVENPAVAIVRIDCAVSLKTKNYFRIDRYPTMIWLSKEVRKEYYGGRDTDDFLKWIRRRSSVSFAKITKLEEWTTLKEGDMAVAFFGDLNSAKGDVWKQFPAELGDIRLGHIVSEALAKSLNMDESHPIIAWNSDKMEEYVYGGNFDYLSVRNWVYDHTDHLVSSMSKMVSRRVFKTEKPALILLRSETGEASNKAEEIFRQSAEGLCKSFRCVITDIDADRHSKTLSFVLGLLPTDQPVFIIVKSGKEVRKYRFDAQDLTTGQLNKFSNDFFDGLLDPYYKSESSDTPLVADANGIINLVGAKFESFIKNRDSDVLVYFYTDRCERCHSSGPEIEAFARRLTGQSTIQVAAMDVMKNDPQGFTVSDLPVVLYWNKGNPDDDPKRMKGPIVEKSLEIFTKRQASQNFTLLPQDPEKKRPRGPRPGHEDL